MTRVGPAGAALLGLTLGCAPTIETSDCDDDRPCAGRGQVCDLDTLSCVDAEVNTDQTADSSLTTFTQTTIPFFRGQICVPHKVKSGSKIPVNLSPCLHPCIEANAYEFKQFFSCIGSSCEAFTTMWVVGDSVPDGCPADAFGRFDRSLCVYDSSVDLSIATEIDSGPISGTMLLEVPFLTNDDAAEIAGFGGSEDDSRDLFEEKVYQYPQDFNRVPNEEAIQLLESNPEPPASCADMGCPCYDVGF